jgi:hypothetical protein
VKQLQWCMLSSSLYPMALRELSLKVIVNRLWMFCVMIACMRMSLVLCSQLVVAFLFKPIGLLTILLKHLYFVIFITWLYLFYYIE